MKRIALGQWIVLALLLPTLAAPVGAQGLHPDAVTLGADLKPEQRTAILKRFGANETADKVVNITADETRSMVGDQMPVAGDYRSIVSSAITCLPPGSGLQIGAENVTGVTPAMYALSLLTAGVGEVNLIIAAPVDAPVEGLEALAGVFKALNSGICGRSPLDRGRQGLALRELTVARDLVKATGNDWAKGADFMRRVQDQFLRAKGDAGATAGIIDTVQHDTGITLPAAERASVVGLFTAIAQAQPDWGGWTAGLDLQSAGNTAVKLMPAGAGQKLPDNLVGHPLVGVVTSVNPLHISIPGNLTPLQLNGNHVDVQRNEKRATLNDLKAGDTVMVTLGTNSDVTQIVAQSAIRTMRGSATAIQNNILTLKDDSGTHQITLAGLPIVRDGKRASATDILPGDTIAVDYNGDGQPTFVTASTPTAASGLSGLFRGFSWPVVLAVLVLLLLIFALLFRRAQTPPAIFERPAREPGRRGRWPRS